MNTRLFDGLKKGAEFFTVGESIQINTDSKAADKAIASKIYISFPDQGGKRLCLFRSENDAIEFANYKKQVPPDTLTSVILPAVYKVRLTTDDKDAKFTKKKFTTMDYHNLRIREATVECCEVLQSNVKPLSGVLRTNFASADANRFENYGSVDDFTKFENEINNIKEEEKAKNAKTWRCIIL